MDLEDTIGRGSCEAYLRTKGVFRDVCAGNQAEGGAAGGHGRDPGEGGNQSSEAGNFAVATSKENYGDMWHICACSPLM